MCDLYTKIENQNELINPIKELVHWGIEYSSYIKIVHSLISYLVTEQELREYNQAIKLNNSLFWPFSLFPYSVTQMELMHPISQLN